MLMPNRQLYLPVYLYFHCSSEFCLVCLTLLSPASFCSRPCSASQTLEYSNLSAILYTLSHSSLVSGSNSSHFWLDPMASLNIFFASCLQILCALRSRPSCQGCLNLFFRFCQSCSQCHKKEMDFTEVTEREKEIQMLANRYSKVLSPIPVNASENLLHLYSSANQKAN